MYPNKFGNLDEMDKFPGDKNGQNSRRNNLTDLYKEQRLKW